MQTVTFIGAGHVASHLAPRHYRAGYTIRQVYSLHIENARELALAVEAQPVNQWQELQKADLYVVALNDQMLRNIGDYWQADHNALVVHTSGSVPLDALAGCARSRGVLYPVQTFSKGRAVELEQVPFCIEANSAAHLEALKTVCKHLNVSGYEMDSDKRQNLHMAAVSINNFNNYLLAMAAQIVEQHNIPFELLKPLALETVEKAFALGPYEAQTGPARRGDWEAVKGHLQKLNNQEQKDLYRKLSEAIYNHYQL